MEFCTVTSVPVLATEGLVVAPGAGDVVEDDARAAFDAHESCPCRPRRLRMYE
jgi:hypothetical protein